jgi:Transglutaminase-like superfamily
MSTMSVPTGSRKTVRVPSLAWCGILLVAARAHLKVRGFARSLRIVRQPLPFILPDAAIDDAELRTVATQVATAAAFFPGRARCLEQALVLCYCLRRAGVAAEVRLGVQPYKFRAHAWVEYQGRAVAEPGERLKTFVTLPTLPI